MAKRLLIIQFILTAFMMNANGQASSFFSLNGGISIPNGDYSSKNLENGAFTTTGVSFGIDGAWYFYKNLGIGADFNYSLHSVDAAALATETFYSFNDPLLNNLYVRSDPYKAMTLMLGVYYNYELINKLSIETRVLSGVMLAYTPFQLIEVEYFILADDYFKKTSSRDHSIAFKGGLAFKYDVGSCLALRVSGDYTLSNMSFGFVNSNGRYIREQKISYFDLNLGLVYKL